jgi:hypothetical protein
LQLKKLEKIKSMELTKDLDDVDYETSKSKFIGIEMDMQ